MDLNDVNRYRAEKDHLMRNEGIHPANYSRVHDVENYPHQPDRTGFVENDGDYDNNKLALRIKRERDSDMMPSAGEQDAQHSSDLRPKYT
jgi:hypothetical protein